MPRKRFCGREVLVGCDHPRFVPIGPIGRWVIAFPIFSNMAAVRHLEFIKKNKYLITWLSLRSYICCCVPNFVKIGSHVWPPDAYNCWMFNAPLLGNGAVARQRPLPWQPHHGGHVRNVMGCDPSFVPIGPLVGELWHFQYFPTWRPTAILNFKSFNIWSRDCQWGFNLLFCTKFRQNWFTHLASRRP